MSVNVEVSRRQFVVGVSTLLYHRRETGWRRVLNLHVGPLTATIEWQTT